MDFTSSNHQDIDRYYRGCYVKFEERGDKLHVIEKITPDYVEGKNEDGDNFRILLSDNNPYQMKFVLPKKSLFLYKNSIFILEKVPAKQFKRGIADSNVTLFNLEKSQYYPLCFDALKAYVNKKACVSFKEAFKNKRPSMLSDRMWYYPEAGKLFLDRVPIYWYNKVTKELTPYKDGLFEDDLKRIME